MIIPEDNQPSPPKGHALLPAEAAVAPPPAYSPPNPPPAPRSPATIPIYVPASALYPARHAEPAGKRFFKAFAVAILVWALLGIATKSIVEAARESARRGRWTGVDDDDDWQDNTDWHTAGPLKEDGQQGRCTRSPMDWTYKDGRVFTSFDLPLSADLFYVFSRGVQSAGNIVITQDGRLHDTDKVHVDVAAIHSTPSYLNAVSVCSLGRRPGQSGIGIFTPRSYPSHGRLPTLEFEITVRLPKLSDSTLLQLGSLETRLPLFTHQIGDLAGHAFFQSIDLYSENARISSHSVNATHITVKTQNSAIQGGYEALSSLKLSTSNGKIDVQVTLQDNEDSRARSEAFLETTNADITSDFKLESPAVDRIGGAFKIVSTTSNGRLSLQFTDAPVDSKLDLTARTSNAPAFVSLHPTFEGNFQARTTNAANTIHFNDKANDPSGRNRSRQVSILHLGPLSRGKVVWGGEHTGHVDVRTQNGPVTLEGR